MKEEIRGNEMRGEVKGREQEMRGGEKKGLKYRGGETEAALSDAGGGGGGGERREEP